MLPFGKLRTWNDNVHCKLLMNDKHGVYVFFFFFEKKKKKGVHVRRV
jgi:hypothetical protein